MKVNYSSALNEWVAVWQVITVSGLLVIEQYCLCFIACFWKTGMCISSLDQYLVVGLVVSICFAQQYFRRNRNVKYVKNSLANWLQNNYKPIAIYFV